MINIVGSVGVFTVSWDPSYEPDILGYVVCGVPGSADFAVSGSNILNVGPETSFTYYPTTSGYFSVKIAAYDSFSNPKALILSDLNFSSLQTVEVLGLASEVLSALNGELTEDHLYQALNDRLDLIDDPTGGLVPKVSSLEGQYTVKMNAGTTHAIGFGLASDVDGSGTSEFMILADKFKVVHPTLPATQAQIFTVGTVNGSPVVGINGAAIVSGTLIVDQNVAVGGSVSIAGATLSFAAPTPSGIGAVATSLANAPAGILNSNVTLGTLGYTGHVNADNTSSILGTTGTLTLNSALTINSLLTISGTAAGVTSGLASYNTNGTGFWISKDSDGNSRLRVGTVAAGELTNGFVWDGSAFKVRGEIQATSGTFSGNITSSATITGGTIQTSNAGRRFVVTSTDNQAEFWGDVGDGTILKLVNIGIGATSQGDDALAEFGVPKPGEATATRTAISAFASGTDAVKAYAASNAGTGGAAYKAWAYDGCYGAKLDGPTGQSQLGSMKAPLMLGMSHVATAPTHAALGGSLWVTSAGIMYINTTPEASGEGTAWQKVGAQ